jgi:oligoendopeptidase F
MPVQKSLPHRSEIPPEQTWDLECVFPTSADWEAACREIETRLPALSAYQGRLAEGPAVLLEFLELYQRSAALMDRVISFALDASAVDTTDSAAAARTGQSRSLQARFRAAVAFLNPELTRIGFDRLKAWMQSAPELAYFAHYVEALERLQAHIQSDEVEAVLALANDPFASMPEIYSMLNDADLSFEPAIGADGSPVEVGQSSIDALLADPDRILRRSAWENYADGYLAFRNTFAAILTTAIKQEVVKARTRRFPSTFQAALAKSQVPMDVYDNLMAVFMRSLPIWHRCWRARRRILGLTELRPADVEAPLTSHPPVIPFRQAVDWICAGMEPLGSEYVEVLRRGCLEMRWIDWAANKGKLLGAYSSGSYTTPPFILLSYNHDLTGLSTLAHELGHSLHAYYVARCQPYLYFNDDMFVAEVASNFNQALVREYLFQTQTEPDFQLALIGEAISNYHRYLFLMPILARFEREVHRRVECGEPLGAQAMIDLMADLFAEGYGGELTFDRERTGITWAQFGHLYLPFYVYQYGAGIAAAEALSRRVLDGVPGAAEQYLDFLKAGSSLFPLDALKRAGIDLSAPEPIEQAFAALAGYVERLEAMIS